MRMPVASKNAFAIAAATGDSAGSPEPVVREPGPLRILPTSSAAENGFVEQDFELDPNHRPDRELRLELDLASQRADRLACDGEPQCEPAVAIAGAVEALEDAGPFVLVAARDHGAPLGPHAHRR
jgi:hypothetical protein